MLEQEGPIRVRLDAQRVRLAPSLFLGDGYGQTQHAEGRRSPRWSDDGGTPRASTESRGSDDRERFDVRDDEFVFGDL